LIARGRSQVIRCVEYSGLHKNPCGRAILLPTLHTRARVPYLDFLVDLRTKRLPVLILLAVVHTSDELPILYARALPLHLIHEAHDRSTCRN